MKDFEDMKDLEIEDVVRTALRKEFPDTAFSVSHGNGELSIDIMGGSLKQYGDNLPREIEERIQNTIFEVAPIMIFFEESDYI